MVLMTLTDGTFASLWSSFQVPKPSFPRSQFAARIVGEKGLIDLDAYGELRVAIDGQWQVVETQAADRLAGQGLPRPGAAGELHAAVPGLHRCVHRRAARRR